MAQNLWQFRLNQGCYLKAVLLLSVCYVSLLVCNGQPASGGGAIACKYYEGFIFLRNMFLDGQSIGLVVLPLPVSGLQNILYQACANFSSPEFYGCAGFSSTGWVLNLKVPSLSFWTPIGYQALNALLRTGLVDIPPYCVGTYIRPIPELVTAPQGFVQAGGYQFYPGMNSDAQTAQVTSAELSEFVTAEMLQLGEPYTTILALAAFCDNDPLCCAFNTSGYVMQQSLLPYSRWTRYPVNYNPMKPIGSVQYNVPTMNISNAQGMYVKAMNLRYVRVGQPGGFNVAQSTSIASQWDNLTSYSSATIRSVDTPPMGALPLVNITVPNGWHGENMVEVCIMGPMSLDPAMYPAYNKSFINMAQTVHHANGSSTTVTFFTFTPTTSFGQSFTNYTIRAFNLELIRGIPLQVFAYVPANANQAVLSSVVLMWGPNTTNLTKADFLMPQLPPSSPPPPLDAPKEWQYAPGGRRPSLVVQCPVSILAASFSKDVSSTPLVVQVEPDELMSSLGPDWETYGGSIVFDMVAVWNSASAPPFTVTSTLQNMGIFNLIQQEPIAVQLEETSPYSNWHPVVGAPTGTQSFAGKFAWLAVQVNRSSILQLYAVLYFNSWTQMSCNLSFFAANPESVSAFPVVVESPPSGSSNSTTLILLASLVPIIVVLSILVVLFVLVRCGFGRRWLSKCCHPSCVDCLAGKADVEPGQVYVVNGTGNGSVRPPPGDSEQHSLYIAGQLSQHKNGQLSQHGNCACPPAPYSLRQLHTMATNKAAVDVLVTKKQGSMLVPEMADIEATLMQAYDRLARDPTYYTPELEQPAPTRVAGEVDKEENKAFYNKSSGMSLNRNIMSLRFASHHLHERTLSSHPVLPDVDLEACPDDITIDDPDKDLLGVGAFGQVYKANYKGRPCAVKVLNAGNGTVGMSEMDMEDLECEIGILARLRHPNIVRMYGACRMDGRAHNLPQTVFIIEELMTCNLHDLIHCTDRAPQDLSDGTRTSKPSKTAPDNQEKPVLPLPVIVSICQDIVQGLAYLHPAIIHRDLKPANVLLDDRASGAKISDFGLARCKYKAYFSTKQPDKGTVAYMAPECFDPEIGKLSCKCDVYSFGVMLWEMLTGMSPWQGETNVTIIFKVAVKGLRPSLPPPDFSRNLPELLSLITRCWSPQPDERPDSAEILQVLMSLSKTLQEQDADAADAPAMDPDAPPTPPQPASFDNFNMMSAFAGISPEELGLEL